MPQAQAVSALDAATTPTPGHRAATRGISRTMARWTNLAVLAAAVAQFYTAGLGVFGAATFRIHAVTGWLVQLASLCTMLLLLFARVPFRITRFAIVIFVLALLQPVLVFVPRASMPSLSALHPLNGLVLVAFAVMLERRIRNRAGQRTDTLSSPTSSR